MNDHLEPWEILAAHQLEQLNGPLQTWIEQYCAYHEKPAIAQVTAAIQNQPVQLPEAA